MRLFCGAAAIGTPLFLPGVGVVRIGTFKALVEAALIMPAGGDSEPILDAFDEPGVGIVVC